ncbi:MAG: hypothetical protein IT532_12790 [Burkholderiales bacterium]|nr:hypothetical protein [Burkholderiales bacterium]
MKHVYGAGSLLAALWVVGAFGAARALAAEPQHAPVRADCPAGDAYIDCMAVAGDRMAIYVQGRTAYEHARETGDFSDALRLSRQLASLGDRNGERLLKMTHMQLGWGAHKDFPQAYAWLTVAIRGGEDYLVRWRDMLAEKMTPEQLAQGKALAGEQMEPKTH